MDSLEECAKLGLKMCEMCYDWLRKENIINCTNTRADMAYEVCVDCLCGDWRRLPYYLDREDIMRHFVRLKTEKEQLQNKLDALEKEVALMPSGELMIKSAEEFVAKMGEQRKGGKRKMAKKKKTMEEEKKNV